MLHAVIDIGSNTIRLCVYDCSLQGSFSQILGRKVTAGLAGHTENGELTQKGIDAAIDALCGFQAVLSHLEVESVSVFATASLRNVTNSVAAAEAIWQGTGYPIDVLSGEEEARLDFLGVMLDNQNPDGLVMDIGGGSCELVRFSQKKIEKAVSLPIGSLKLYRGFVRELFPTSQEAQSIRAEVMHCLEQEGVCTASCKTVLGVGGTLRHVARLCAAMGEGRVDGFSVEAFHKVLSQLCADPKFALEQIISLVPERVHTLIPGMLLFDVVSDYYRCERVIISKYGVREGFLADRILKNFTVEEQQNGETGISL